MLKGLLHAGVHLLKPLTAGIKAMGLILCSSGVVEFFSPPARLRKAASIGY